MIYSRLAKQAAEYFVAHRTVMSVPPVVPAELRQQRACFVTILENPGRYSRAISGAALPSTTSLAEEIIMHTSRALTNSVGRPVRRQDLRSLVYSIAVLGPLQRISDKAHLDPIHFGLYVRSDAGKSALLLPQRPGVDTAEDQIATALREGGINQRDETVTMYRFDVLYDDTVF